MPVPLLELSIVGVEDRGCKKDSSWILVFRAFGVWDLSCEGKSKSLGVSLSSAFNLARASKLFLVVGAFLFWFVFDFLVFLFLPETFVNPSVSFAVEALFRVEF